MRKILFFIILFSYITVSAQKLKDTVLLKDINGIIHKAVLHKTDDGWYYYETDYVDSSKYFYHRYLLLKENGVPDSMNHWYWKLKSLK